jgi:hypothetical protein
MNWEGLEKDHYENHVAIHRKRLKIGSFRCLAVAYVTRYPPWYLFWKKPIVESFFKDDGLFQDWYRVADEKRVSSLSKLKLDLDRAYKEELVLEQLLLE